MGGLPWLRAQECPTPGCVPELLASRELVAVKVSLPAPVIDGRLDEAEWSSAPRAARFVQREPEPGAEALLSTEASVLFDEDAVYVGVWLHDPEPGRIQAPFLRRDDEGISDWVFVEIDSRFDRRTGFSLGVNPRGVQCDGAWSNDTLYDASWNAVWEAAARVVSSGWTAEFRIPFSQLTFQRPSETGTGDSVWGFNVFRSNPRTGEVSNWAPRFSRVAGVVSRFNRLRLRLPQRRGRAEMTPYVSPQFEQNPRPGPAASTLKAGGDFSTGLGSAFNVTGTVLPDFGQVEADPSQVNLTAFELFQAERRPFFVEGLDTFRFDTALAFKSRGNSFENDAPFYSRRIGRPPEGELPAGALPADAPRSSTLLAALKLTGRTASGWTVGAFGSLTDHAEATIPAAQGDTVRWPLQPREGVGVLRVSRDLRNGESSLGGFLSAAERFGFEPRLAEELPRRSWTAGFDGRHRYAGQTYELRGFFLASRVEGTSASLERRVREPWHYFQRPDAERETPRGALNGFAAEGRWGKVGGVLRVDLAARAVSPGFDVNDIGFQRGSDWLILAATWRFERYPRSGPVRLWTVGSENLGVGWSFAGETRARATNAFVRVDFRDYSDLKLSLDHELESLSTEWLRGGPAVLLPPRSGLRVTAHSDQRKASFVGLEAGIAREPASRSSSVSIAPTLTLRASDRLLVSLASTYQDETIGWQHVAQATVDARPEHLVGRVRQRTEALTLRADLAFSSRFVFQLYLQPFASQGRYDAYQRLADARNPSPARRFQALGGTACGETVCLDLDGDGTGDLTVADPSSRERSLNATAVLRWEYRPASFLTLVWTQRRRSLVEEAEWRPARELGAAFTGPGPATNVLLLKASYRLGK
jgi:hypothetical protein